MWGDPARTVWVTNADKEPTEIDFSLLSKQTADAVKQALALGILVETDNFGKVLKAEKVKTSPFAGKQDLLEKNQTFEEKVEQGELGVSTDIYQKAKKIVKSGLSTIRREIEQLGNVQLLRVCIELEKKNKNRKTVLALFEAQLIKAKDLNNPANLNFYESIIEETEEKIVTFSPEEGGIDGSTSNS